MSYMPKPREERSIWWPRLEKIATKGWEKYPYDETVVIDQFDGTDNFFLSNFFPFEITIDNVKYDSNEHYYQSKKPVEGAVDENGQLWSEKIRLASNAAKTKKLGKQCPIRPDWEQIKNRVMKEALIAKFKGTSLEKRLLSTGNTYLVEGNTWHDNWFGICVLKDCTRCKDKMGKNHLGQFLMELRLILQGMPSPLQ